jgi:hypothetical protein
MAMAARQEYVSSGQPDIPVGSGPIFSAEEPAMSELSRDEVLAAVHPIDDATIAEIIATGADHDELVKACHFYAKDRARKSPQDVPPGRVGRVVSILERAEVEVHESWLGEFGSLLS